MKLLMKKKVIETIGDEAIPPAEVVAYQQYRSAGRIDCAFENNIVEMPL